MGKPLTLLFDPLQSIVLFLSGVSHLAPSLTQQFLIHDAVCSYHCQLHRSGRQVKLARRDDPDMYVHVDNNARTFLLTICDESGLYLIVAVTFWFYPGT